MKKLLIASAALAMVAGTAQAQSSVTVYGLIDMGYTSVENDRTLSSGATTTNKVKSTGNGDGALATSRFGVRGTEDLGGGLKANFVLEYDLVDAGVGGNGQQNSASTANASQTASANNAGFGARYSWVGLEDAKLGSLRLGRQEQSIHSVVVAGSAGAANNVTGAIYSAGLADVSTNDAGIRPHNVFVNRAVTYISPAFNGFRVELQTADQEITTGTASPAKATETGGSLKYAAGKFAAAYGMATSKSTASGNTSETKGEQQAISASYDLGMVKVFALNTERKNTVGGELVAKTKATELGVQAPMGKTTLWASAFDGDRDGSVNTAITALSSAEDMTAFGKTTADVSGYQVGARYDLSKRTALYGIYGKQEVKATAGAASGAKVESQALAFGVRHSF
jgi:predicted porin